MNERERFLTTMNHQRPDRIPTIIDTRLGVQETLKNYYRVSSFQEVLDIMGAVETFRFPNDGWIKLNFPGYDEKAELMEGAWKDYDRGGVLKYIKIDEKIFKDSWGAFWRISDDEEFVGWLSGPLVNAKDPDEIDEIFIPGINDIVDDPNLPKNVQELKEKGIFVRGTITQVYKQAWMLRGMQNVLMDFLINKPFIEKLYDKIYRLDGEILRRMTKSGMDMVGFDGDIAMQHSLMMGENIWRAFDKPRLAEVVALCKKTNPDVHIYMHSDGDISKVIPDLIEIGFDVIDPIQPESMDPIKQKKLFGDKITLHGCGSLQKTLPFGTPEDCRKEAIYYIEQCGQNGGLVLGASNTINYDVPVQNIVAWYEAVRDYIFK